jgi:acetaldehyde dehydrogenase
LSKVKVAIIGPGNIGTDLMYKVFRSEYLEMGMMAGIMESEGIRRAASLGVKTSIEGAPAVTGERDIKIVFEATSASAHLKNAPLLKEAGQFAVDLTPAAVGPYCVPCVNLGGILGERNMNINMVTCGGQATIPIVYAVSRAAGAEYAEIVACISSRSAGPGTRANMDEFTETTSRAIVKVGGAEKGKAIIVLNPADPPLMMTNTIIVRIKDKTVPAEVITNSVMDIVRELVEYVPGYRLRVPPIIDGDKVTTIVEVQGQGDFLPPYSGNLDIINSAAVAAAEVVARDMLGEGF